MQTRRKGSRRTSRSSQAKRRTNSKKKAASRPHRKPLAPRRLRRAAKAEDRTLVYECTRPGCGYRIWRDDKGQAGELRFDLKCPKCHNREFRCLGKGAIPETFNLPETTALDLDTIKPAVLGSTGLE